MPTIASPIGSPPKKISGRRRLHFNSYDDVLADAEKMQGVPHRQLGNWTLPMIVQHLANGIQGSIEGGTFRVKWYLRLIGPLLIKKRLIHGPFPRGFQLPRSAAARLVAAPDVSYEASMASLRQAIARLNTEPQRGAHPVIGKLTTAEWDQFHLRHAEMHLGFIVPEA